MSDNPGTLETHLRKCRADGRKILIPYITGGYPVGQWTRLIDGLAGAGADAIEVGIPFSDPVIDGPTIQESSMMALEAGATPASILAELKEVTNSVPLIAMTYYNICFRMGHKRFASSLAEAGVSAAILPDLPVGELDTWADAAVDGPIETVLLAPPTVSDAQLKVIGDRAQGFVYGVGLVGTTGERSELSSSALDIATRLKAVTDKPVIIGIGVSTPSQAAEISKVADGVVVGSAVIRKMLGDGSIDDAVEFVGEIRAALDQA